MVDKIKQTFFEKFDGLFRETNPQWKEVFGIFQWLGHEASCARRFEHLAVIDDLRRDTESHFSRFKDMRRKVEKSSQKVNEAIKKRDEHLRTIHTRKAGKLPLIGAETEEDKIPPSQ